MQLKYTSYVQSKNLKKLPMTSGKSKCKASWSIKNTKRR